MQLQGLMFMLIMLVIFPLVILSSNQNLFFTVIALILVISSLNAIQKALFKKHSDQDEEYSELIEEIEDSINIDVKRFGIGTKVVKDLIVILFFIYCSFFLHLLWMKMMVALVILYWLHNIKRNLSQPLQPSNGLKHSKINSFLDIVVNLSMLLVIVLTAYNK